MPEAVGVRDIRLMKEMGVNFFRTSHYPQDVAVLDACDEMGILVWEEVPNIAIHIYPPPEDGTEPVYTTRFPWPLMENLKQQLKEMVERDRNRPSVIIWGFADDLSEYQFPEDFAELSDYTHSARSQPLDGRPGAPCDGYHGCDDLRGPVGRARKAPRKDVHLERMGGNSLRARARRARR